MSACGILLGSPPIFSTYQCTFVLGLEILQNSLESTYARASFLVKLQALDIFVFSFRYFLLKAQPLKLDRHVKILLLRGLVDCRDVCSRK